MQSSTSRAVVAAPPQSRTRPAYPGAPFDASGMCLSHPNVRLCRPRGDDEDTDGKGRRRYEIVRKTCPLCPSLRKVGGKGRGRRREAEERKKTRGDRRDRNTARAPGRHSAEIRPGTQTSSGVRDAAAAADRTPAADRRAMYALSTSAVDGGRTNSDLSDVLVHEISAVADDSSSSSFDEASFTSETELGGSRDGSDGDGDDGSEGGGNALADRRAMFTLSTSAVDGGMTNSDLSDLLVHEISASVPKESSEAASDTSATEEAGSSGESEGNSSGGEEGAPPARTKSMYAREYDRLVRTHSALAVLRDTLGRMRPSFRAPRGKVGVVRIESGGGVREVPMYPKGMKVYYRSNSGGDGGTTLARATILSVHQDDTLEPYYTIRVDGREKQTDNDHIVLSP